MKSEQISGNVQKYVVSLTARSESCCRGICRVCAKCKSAVRQGGRCVGHVRPSLPCDPLTGRTKCVLLVGEGQRNSLRHRRRADKAEKNTELRA